MSSKQISNTNGLAEEDMALPTKDSVICPYVTTPALMALQTSLDKVSHSMRSNLAVVKAITDDLIGGYKCDDSDIQLAAQALERVVNILNTLSVYSAPLGAIIGVNRTINQTLLILSCTCSAKSAELYGDVFINDVSVGGLSTAATLPQGIDTAEITLPLMLVYALQAIIAYAAICSVRGSKLKKGSVELSLKAYSSGKNSASISFFRSQTLTTTLDTKENFSKPCGQKEKDVLDGIIATDSDPSTLGLLYAKEVIGGNGGRLSGDWAEGRFIINCEY